MKLLLAVDEFEITSEGFIAAFQGGTNNKINA